MELPGNRVYSATHDGWCPTPTELWKSCATDAIDKQKSTIQSPLATGTDVSPWATFPLPDVEELGTDPRIPADRCNVVRVLVFTRKTSTNA